MTKPRQWQPMFDGNLGLKQGYAITNMPPGSCLDIKNMYLNGLGGKSPRGGYVELFHTTEQRLGNGSITGTPVIGATLLQATTGATATIKEIGSGYLVVESVTGTFDNSHVVTGTNPDLNGTLGKIVAFSDYSGTVAGTVRATTAVAHGLPAGTSIISISGTTDYNGIFTVTYIDATSFYFTDTYVSAETYGLAKTTFTFTPTTLTSVRLTDKVRSLLQFSPQGGTVEQLAFAGTKIFKQNSTTATVVRGGLTNNRAWEWIQYRDKVLGVNGVTSFLYNGTTFTSISITPPTANVTYTDIGSGALNAGNYQYLVTFYDSTTGRESNPALYPATAPSILAVGATGKVSITTFPSPVVGEGVDSYRIYRKRQSETIFTRLATVPLTTTTYVDNDNVTGTIEMEYDTGQMDEGNTPAPLSDLICEQFDRVFMVDPTDPSILIYSRKGIYHAFPSGNFFYVGRGDGSRIIRIEKHGKMLLIHKKNGWYLLADDPDTATPQLLSKVGTQDFRCSVSAHNQVVRLTPTGFYRAVPTDYSTTDLREDYIGQDVADYENAMDWANSQYINCYNYNAFNRRHVYIIQPALSQSATTLYYSKCWVFDIVLSQWVYFEIGTDVYSVADYVTDNKKYMMMGDGYGIIWQWDIGNSDGSDLASLELNGTMTSAGATSVTDTSKTWTVNSLIGCMVSTWSGAGALQKRRVISNTANTLTLDLAWTITPDNTTVYSVAAIDQYADEYWDSNGDPHLLKRMRWIVPYVRQTGNYDVEITLRRDFAQAYEQASDINLSSGSSTWGTFIWGTGTWGGRTSNLQRLRLNGKYHYYSIRYRNRNAAEPLNWDGHGAVFQVLPDRY